MGDATAPNIAGIEAASVETQHRMLAIPAAHTNWIGTLAMQGGARIFFGEGTSIVPAVGRRAVFLSWENVLALRDLCNGLLEGAKKQGN